MCGIVGYVGKKHCKDFVLQGLSRLEYRGYDSAGFVCLSKSHNHLCFEKKVGKVSVLQKSLEQVSYDGFVGMGHSRWATHGVVNEQNAHPHFNCDKTIAIVHNGIVESFQDIKDKLIAQGHDFYSSTDTEVVAHFFSSLVSFHKTLKSAIVDLVNQLQGAYAFVILMEEYPDQLIVVRRKSPLSIGVGDGEMFVASDLLAFSDKTNKVLFMPDESFAIIKKDGIELFDFFGKTIVPKTQQIDVAFDEVDKKGFDHFMLKEIYEQKIAIDRSVSFCKLLGSEQEVSDYLLSIEYQDRIWHQLGLRSDQVKKIKKINLVAAGTSWHACRISQFFFEHMCRIPTQVFLASEFCYMPFFPQEDSIFIFVSQSGETADTLQAMRLVNEAGISTVAITNVASSTMVREAGGFLPMQAGPEIAVASTKAFSTQMAVLYWLSSRIALEKGLMNLEQMKKNENDLFIAAEVLETVLEDYKWDITQTLAKRYAVYERFIFLGRHLSYPFALEAALKLKEISYIFAQCYPAGELKHGPIALIDDKTPVILFSVLDDVIYQKLFANAQEVKARNGHLLSFAFEGQDELIKLSDYAFIIPKVTKNLGPLAMSGLMQFFVYHITKELGCPIDKPRNLAKSVTVE